MSGESVGQQDQDVKPKRRALSKKTRFEVFKRDGFKCQYCGAHPPGVLLHVDHVLAVACGGNNTLDNLITACEPCNLGKGARDLKVKPRPLAEKARQAAELEEQLLGYQALLESKRQRVEREAWQVMAVLYPGQDTVRRDELISVQRFIARLGVHEVLDAADVTMTAWRSKPFLYFCGVCWSKVREAGA